jgi:cystathionine beta-lyase
MEEKKMNQFDKIINRRNTNSLKWEKYGDIKDIIAMGSADMDFESATCIRDALINKAAKAMYGYEARSEEYFESIINWNKRLYNYKIEKAWLSNVPGVFAGIHLALETFSKCGESVLMHSPHFGPLVRVIEKCKRKLVTSPLKLIKDQYEIDFEDFENKIIENNVKMFVLVNPQNPTGKVYTKEELIRIGEICEKYKVIVISDEVHCNTLFDNNIHYPYTAVNEVNADHGIVITSITKAFNVQGLTYGILIIPNLTHRQMFEKAIQSYDWDFATNIFSMAAVIAAYNNGSEWLQQVNEYLLENLNYITKYIDKNIPAIKVIRPQGSYMVWLDMRVLGLSPEELKILLLQKAKVAFTFGEEFGEEGQGFERLNFACPRKILEEALVRIKNVIETI